jgi:hypothetical protein
MDERVGRQHLIQLNYKNNPKGYSRTQITHIHPGNQSCNQPISSNKKLDRRQRAAHNNKTTGSRPPSQKHKLTGFTHP